MLIQTATARPHAGSEVLLDRAGIPIAAECRAAEAVGGDFYLVLPRGAGSVAIVIGDVCGRGEDGAKLVPLVSPSVDELVRGALSPALMLSEIDDRLQKLLPLDRFVTLAAIEIDTHATELTLANAGHVPAMVRSGDHVRIVGRASGPPLGLGCGASYAEERVSLAPGDVLVLMTDGLLEAVETDLVGMSSLKRLLARAPKARARFTGRFSKSSMARWAIVDRTTSRCWSWSFSATEALGKTSSPKLARSSYALGAP